MNIIYIYFWKNKLKVDKRSIINKCTLKHNKANTSN